MMLVFLVGLVLGQAAAEGPDGGSPGPPAPRPPRTADTMSQLLKKLPEAEPAERTRMLAEIKRLYASGATGPLLPPDDVDLLRYTALSPVDQARLAARSFVEDLLGGDAGALVSHCGVPFMLEDRKLERVEDLRAEWARSVGRLRTDLLRLNDIEVLTVQEMEKKYGPPPRRLQGWPLHAGVTYLAVANLSGRAVVLLLRQAGATWQIVGFSD